MVGGLIQIDGVLWEGDEGGIKGNDSFLGVDSKKKDRV
jgi:hypothetical protein